VQHQLLKLINEQHIAVDLCAESNREAIQRVCYILARTGDIREKYWEDVYKREKEFPTGLPTFPVAVAIPHADPDHVVRTAVAIGVLKSPVLFRQMGADPSKTLQVWIIFLLAIKEREKQVDLLQGLMKLVQDKDLLKKILDSQAPSSVLKAIKESK